GKSKPKNRQIVKKLHSVLLHQAVMLWKRARFLLRMMRSKRIKKHRLRQRRPLKSKIQHRVQITLFLTLLGKSGLRVPLPNMQRRKIQHP
ncbi:hypothetical protein AD953_00580, partial [Acetobacter malorum]